MSYFKLLITILFCIEVFFLEGCSVSNFYSKAEFEIVLAKYHSLIDNEISVSKISGNWDSDFIILNNKKNVDSPSTRGIFSIEIIPDIDVFCNGCKNACVNNIKLCIWENGDVFWSNRTNTFYTNIGKEVVSLWHECLDKKKLFSGKFSSIQYYGDKINNNFLHFYRISIRNSNEFVSIGLVCEWWNDTFFTGNMKTHKTEFVYDNDIKWNNIISFLNSINLNEQDVYVLDNDKDFWIKNVAFYNLLPYPMFWINPKLNSGYCKWNEAVERKWLDNQLSFELSRQFPQ